MALKSLLVTPTNPALPVDGTLQFTCTGIDSNGSTSDLTSTAVWTSLNPAIATVDATGMVTAVADGTAQIQAATQGKTSSAVVTVNVTLVSMVVTPAQATIVSGLTQQFTVTGTYSDNSTADISESADWSSQNSIASVESDGLATGVAAGVTAVVARYGSLVAGAKLIVTSATVGLTPCQRLAKAEAQLEILMMGGAVRSVETPQLGRVEYSGVSAVDLNRLIAALRRQCAESMGIYGKPRGPISVEVEP